MARKVGVNTLEMFSARLNRIVKELDIFVENLFIPGRCRKNSGYDHVLIKFCSF